MSAMIEQVPADEDEDKPKEGSVEAFWSSVVSTVAIFGIVGLGALVFWIFSRPGEVVGWLIGLGAK